MGNHFADLSKMVWRHSRHIMLCVALAACSTPHPEAPLTVRTVYVPTYQPCAPKMGPEPTYPDSAAAILGARDIYERVQLLLAARELRTARLNEQKAALAECAAPVKTP